MRYVILAALVCGCTSSLPADAHKLTACELAPVGSDLYGIDLCETPCSMLVSDPPDPNNQFCKPQWSSADSGSETYNVTLCDPIDYMGYRGCCIEATLPSGQQAVDFVECAN